MAASHSGEPFHIEAVRSILHKSGLDERALQCGADLPSNESARRALTAEGTTPAPVYHNCSGKHAGILALCRAIGADPATYMELDNPAQRTILEFCARMSDQRIDELPVAVDGCGIPVYATSLRNAALAYVRYATLCDLDGPSADALRSVRTAMAAFPEYMSGTGEFDASLMRAYGGTLVCKGGAEGVHGVAIVDRGIALVTKIVDGHERARAPAVLYCLKAAGAITPAQLKSLASFAVPVLRNRAGRAVGEIRAARGGPG